MKRANFISAEEAALLIDDGSTVCPVAMTLVSSSESILKAIENRFLETGHPKDLTLLHSCGQSDRERGLQHFAHEGLVKRIIGSHWGLQPRWMDMISKSQVEAFCLPQGQIAQLYRSMACGLPGKISKVGLGTFIDPRVEGGKMNTRTENLENIVDILTIDNEEYMFYKKIPLDIVIIRGTTCDENGNLTTTEEAMKLEVLPAVLAAKRFGGKVLAQVKHVAKNGTLNPKEVTVPGVFIDAVIVCDEPEQDHRQTSSWFFDPAYCGELNELTSEKNSLEFNERKFIARRGVMEISGNDIINLGTGIPNDMIGAICEEEDISELVTITVESGIYGGIQAGGIDFGIGKNLEAMITHHEQMDYYNGTGVDITFMGLGELDKEGNVNSTKMGDRCTGAGGFIDITQNAKKIVFLGTFSARGARYTFNNDGLIINQEGSIKKMVDKVKQVSFNGTIARKKGQDVKIVTERCVFKLVEEGVLLTEIAPGVDLKKDILDQMEFEPYISENLKIMDERLFDRNNTMGLKQDLLGGK